MAENVDANGKDSVASVPTDVATLDLLKRRWNRGYRAFLAGIDPAAREGRRPYTGWTFLSRPVEVSIDPNGTGPDNINGESWRYRLPDGVTTRPMHAWVLESNDRSLGPVVRDGTSHEVTSILASTKTSAGAVTYPYVSACRPIDSPNGSDGGSAWEVIVAPRPQVQATMTAQFRLQPRDLTILTSRTIAGSQHDLTISKMAVVEWMRADAGSGNRLSSAVADAAAAMDASVELDKGLTPRTVGRVFDPSLFSTSSDRAAGRRLAGTTVNVTIGT